MSLFCTLVNSTFATMAWNNNDTIMALVCFALAWYCGWNFITGVKEDYYDQEGK